MIKHFFKVFTFLFIACCTMVLSDCEYTPYTQGEVLYKFHCESCHMEDGSGLKMLIPPLAGSDYLKNNQESIPCILKNGLKGPISVNGKIYDTEMVGIESLNDVQINNIINYINHAWGNNFGQSNVKVVDERLKSCLSSD